MWNNLLIKGMIERVADRLKRELMVFATDGSYNGQANVEVSGIGWVVYCKDAVVVIGILRVV